MNLEEFEVVVLDIDSINKGIDDFVKADPNIDPDDKKNCTYRIKASKLCYTVSNSGKVGIFDSELCGKIIEKGNKYPIEIFKIKETEAGKEFGILPEFESGISVEVLMYAYIKGTVSVSNFMDTRYNYNSRIMNNQLEFIKFITQE